MQIIPLVQLVLWLQANPLAPRLLSHPDRNENRFHWVLYAGFSIIQ